MSILATLADNTLSVSAGAFSVTIEAGAIARNWDALSHFPERRARLALSDLASRLNYFSARLERLASEGGAVDVPAEAERFARRHVELVRRAWAVESRCMSWFIVGPANFPTARNQKRQASRDKAYQAAEDHTAAALRAIERTAWPHGAPGDAIRANHPDAPALIRAKIEQRRHMHALMKAANAAIREAKTTDKAALAEAIQGATGWKAEMCLKLVNPPQGFPVGFASFSLSGELAEIKRLEGRLAAIEANRARGEVETTHNTTEGALRIVENPDAARIQLFFPGKPSDAARSVLKSNGFRWAPSEGAWQRHLNNAGRYAASRVRDALQAEAPAPAPKPEAAAGTHVLYGRAYRVTAEFQDRDATNAYLRANPGEGVLEVVGERILVARMDDEGQPVAAEARR